MTTENPHVLTQTKLKEILCYDPKTGIFEWIKISKYHSEKLNTPAGSIQRCKNRHYINIQLNGKKYRAHRLAFLYMSNFMPNQVDHINGNGMDNRWENITPCTHFQNSQNHTKRANGSGLPAGLRKLKSGRYHVRITAFKKVHYLGTYDTVEEAGKAYESSKRELHYCPARNMQ